MNEESQQADESELNIPKEKHDSGQHKRQNFIPVEHFRLGVDGAGDSVKV